MQTIPLQPYFCFPPLLPFLDGVNVGTGSSPWGTASLCRQSTMMNSFVLPSMTSLQPVSSPRLLPTSSLQPHGHYLHQHDDPHSLVLPSPTGSSPLLCQPRPDRDLAVIAPTYEPVQHATLPPLRSWLLSTLAAVGPDLGGVHSTYRPVGVLQRPTSLCWAGSASPLSFSTTTTERRLQMAKRKRAASVPPTSERRALTTALQTKREVTFANGAQVSMWKLNGQHYKRRKVTDSNGVDQWKKCGHCGTDSTPEWRNGPLGKGTLCNACGLRYRSRQREQRSRDQSGNVPVSLLLSPESETKKGCRNHINHPMIWVSKLSTVLASQAVSCQPHQHVQQL